MADSLLGYRKVHREAGQSLALMTRAGVVLGIACLLAPMGCSLGTSTAVSPETIRRHIESRRGAEAVRDARRFYLQTIGKYGEKSLESARALDLLSDSFVAERGTRDERALEAAIRSLETREGLLPPRSPELAVSLHQVGALRYRRGEYELARPLLTRALSIREEALPSGKETATSLLYLASLHSDTGDDRAALQMVDRAIPMYRGAFPASAEDLALCWNVRGSILYRSGDFSGAVSSFETSIRFTESSGGGQSAAMGRTLFNLGGVLLHLGEVDQARETLSRSLRIRRQTGGARSEAVASTYYVLGVAQEDAGDLESAAGSFGNAIAIGEETGGMTAERLAYPLVGLARIHLTRGDSTRAEPLLRRALSIRESALGTEHPSVAEILVPMAAVRMARGDTASARIALSRALRLQRTHLGKNHPDTGVTLEALAAYHERVGIPGLALEEALEAERIGREHLRSVALGLPEHQALAYAGVRKSGLERACSILEGGFQDPNSRVLVWDALIRSRLVVLDEVARRLQWMSTSTDPETVSRLRHWSEARRRLAVLAVQGAPEGEETERVRREADAIEREVAAGMPTGAPTSSDGSRQTSHSLPDDTGLVSYVRDETSYAAFILAPHESIPEFIRLGSREEVDTSISEWARSVWAGMSRAGDTAERDCRKRGERVRSLIFDPVRKRLGPVRRVLVVPDGSLYQVNFYALPWGGEGYLVEDGVVIHELTCERDLIHLSPPDHEGNRALVVGAPDYDRATNTSKPATGSALGLRGATPARVPGRASMQPCPELSSLRFHQLPGALEEASEVAEMLSHRGGRTSTVVLTGIKATEEAVKRSSEGKDLLHFATHAFYLGACARPVRLTRGFGAVVPSRPHSGRQAVLDRPLLLSGLALAGANRREASTTEDGILTGEEIACMNLSGTSLAVLSGCETGLGGQERNEGIVGLRRAFRIAGVRTLILSLWPVEDQAAREWMHGLYEARWKSGMDTAGAVREASLRVLRELRARKRSTHPWHWAAFVAAGDWD